MIEKFEMKDICKITLKEKFLLFFHRPIITCDMANNRMYFVMAKRMFGRIYIIKQWESKAEDGK